MSAADLDFCSRPPRGSAQPAARPFPGRPAHRHERPCHEDAARAAHRHQEADQHRGGPAQEARRALRDRVLQEHGGRLARRVREGHRQRPPDDPDLQQRQQRCLRQGRGLTEGVRQRGREGGGQAYLGDGRGAGERQGAEKHLRQHLQRRRERPGGQVRQPRDQPPVPAGHDRARVARGSLPGGSHEERQATGARRAPEAPEGVPHQTSGDAVPTHRPDLGPGVGHAGHARERERHDREADRVRDRVHRGPERVPVTGQVREGNFRPAGSRHHGGDGGRCLRDVPRDGVHARRCGVGVGGWGRGRGVRDARHGRRARGRGPGRRRGGEDGQGGGGAAGPTRRRRR